jgi:hypothetical protein
MRAPMPALCMSRRMTRTHGWRLSEFSSPLTALLVASAKRLPEAFSKRKRDQVFAVASVPH